MKRLFALILSISTLLSCAACYKVFLPGGSHNGGETTAPSQTEPEIADETQQIQNLITAGEYQQAYDLLEAIETPTPEQVNLRKGFHYQLVEEKRDDGSILYTYDSRGNLIHKVNNIRDEEYTYTYDEKDNLLTEEYQLGDYSTKTENIYDQDGVLTDCYYSTNNGKSLHYGYSYAYDQNGNVTEKNTCSYGEEYTWKSAYTYDDRGNVLTEKSYASGELISTTTYTYDENNNVLTKDVVSTYDFENAHTDYTYDENGNLLTEEETTDSYVFYRYTCTYDAKGNRITYDREDTEGKYHHTYTYDENGNMIQEYIEGQDYYSSSSYTSTRTYTWKLFFNPNRTE